MANLGLADCCAKLLKLQEDLRQKNGQKKAAVADELEPVITSLKDLIQKDNSRDEMKNSSTLLSSPEPATKKAHNLQTEPTPVKDERPDRIYPRLSDIHAEPLPENCINQEEESTPSPELFSSNTYKHELDRKDRLVSVVKKCRKTLLNRQTIALVDSHPNWQTLHKHAPSIGIIQVGGLCYPSAAAGLNELNKLGFCFPNAKSIVIALGCNDIAHARSARHDLSTYSSSWLPRFCSEIKKLLPNATMKFLLPFAGRTVPQHSIDKLQEQLKKTFPQHPTLQSPFYAPSDFEDHIHLCNPARNNYTTFLAKILTNGNLQNTSVNQGNPRQQQKTPLMTMNFNTARQQHHLDTYNSQHYRNNQNSTYAQVAANSSTDSRSQPNLRNATHLSNMAYPLAQIPPTPGRTYAQVVAHNSDTAISTHEIINQLTSLLPKLISVISNYQ